MLFEFMKQRLTLWAFQAYEESSSVYVAKENVGYIKSELKKVGWSHVRVYAAPKLGKSTAV
jgi:hypothetical protein